MQSCIEKEREREIERERGRDDSRSRGDGFYFMKVSGRDALHIGFVRIRM